MSTTEQPDFIFQYHASINQIVTVFTDLIDRLRVGKNASCTLGYIDSPRSGASIYNFKLAPNGAVIDLRAARFLAKHVGIVHDKFPNSELSRVREIYKLFGGDQDVWLSYFENTSLDRVVEALSYLLSLPPIKPERPNAYHTHFSGKTRAPFPELTSLPIDLMINSVAITLGSHPVMSRFLEDTRKTKESIAFFGNGPSTYADSIIYLAKSIREMNAIFKIADKSEANEAVMKFVSQIMSDMAERAEATPLLSKKLQALVKAKREEALQAPDDEIVPRLDILREITFELGAQLYEKFPDGFIPHDEHHRIELAIDRLTFSAGDYS